MISPSLHLLQMQMRYHLKWLLRYLRNLLAPPFLPQRNWKRETMSQSEKEIQEQSKVQFKISLFKNYAQSTAYNSKFSAKAFQNKIAIHALNQVQQKSRIRARCPAVCNKRGNYKIYNKRKRHNDKKSNTQQWATTKFKTERCMWIVRTISSRQALKQAWQNRSCSKSSDLLGTRIDLES